MRRLLFILFLLPMLGFSQALQRQFFTTNTAPNVVVTAGTNAFITFSLIGQQRTYRIDTPASGTATNIVWPVQGTNVYLTTNGLAIVIDVPSPLIPWQAITNITSIQIPAAAVTNAPWSTTGQTNLALTVAGTNVFVHSVTNLGVTTYTIDVPLQPQQTNWSWQSITNIATVQIPYSSITNPPAAGGQTNLALVVSGTNVFVSSVTNLGVTTFTIDVPATGGSGQTNVTLVVAGTNSFVHSTTNSGVITYTIDVPTYVQTNISWQAVTNLQSSQMPYTVITNAPWSTGGQTNLALVVGGTNAYVTPATNLGVTTFTVDGPAIRTQWSVGDITNAGTLAYSNVSVLIGATNTATLTTQLGLSSYTNTTTLTTQLGLGTAAYSNTAAFLLKSGDTSTGPQLTTSASTNAPAGNEFVTGAWVRGLINQGFFEYASTNIISGTNADSPNQFLYEFHMQHIPDSAVRVWPNTFLTNGGYVGSVSTTNTFQSIAGQILVNAYIGLSSGGGDALSLKPEIYLSTDRSNWYGDFDCSAQAITPGITQLYSFVVSFPAQTATNPAGFYIERRLKVTSKGGSPTMYFLVGTNAISGTNSASHISINAAPVQGGTFSGVFIGNGYGLTNIPQSAISNALPRVVGITIDGGGSAITSGTKGFLEVPYSATIQSGTILADQVGSIQIETWRTNSGNLTLLARAGSLGTNWLTTTNWQRDVTLTGWSSVALAANDILGFTVTTNAASVTRATLQLKLQP